MRPRLQDVKRPQNEELQRAGVEDNQDQPSIEMTTIESMPGAEPHAQKVDGKVKPVFEMPFPEGTKKSKSEKSKIWKLN